MSVLFLVVPLALVLVAVAVGAFLWSSRGGQFDDLDTPPLRMMHDEEIGDGRLEIGGVIRSAAREAGGVEGA